MSSRRHGRVESVRSAVRRRSAWGIRIVAYGLPVLVVVAAIADLNLWPATGWRLFSGVRTGTEATWMVEVEAPDGSFARIDPGADVEARRSWRHQLDRAANDPDRQDQLCRLWLREARRNRPTTVSLRIQRGVIEIPRRAGPATLKSSRVVHQC